MTSGLAHIVQSQMHPDDAFHTNLHTQAQVPSSFLMGTNLQQLETAVEDVEGVRKKIKQKKGKRRRYANLLITPEEQVAEIYMFGKTHYEYSKMVDYLANSTGHSTSPPS